MHKKLVVAFILLLVSSLALVSCAAEELEPVTVELDDVYHLFQGKESSTFAVVLSITNPNMVDVTIDALEYQVEALGQPLAAAQIVDDCYIPRDSEVKVTAAFTVPLNNIIGALLMANGTLVEELPEAMQIGIEMGAIPAAQIPGLIQAAAVLRTLPIWNALGGVNPGALPANPFGPSQDAAWAKGNDLTAEYTVTGTAYMDSDLGAEEVSFTDTWQETG